MFADYFVLGCTGICLFSTYKALAEAFKARTDNKVAIRKLEYGEILDISTVLANIDRLEREAVQTWSHKPGKKSHLLVMRGKLQSDTALTSRFRPHEKLLVKVHLWMIQGTAYISDQHP